MSELISNAKSAIDSKELANYKARVNQLEKQVKKFVDLNSYKLEAVRIPILGYWDIRGLGASLRYLLSYCNVPYENRIYQSTEVHSTGRTWFGIKHLTTLDFPNLPYFVDTNGSKITES